MILRSWHAAVFGIALMAFAIALAPASVFLKPGTSGFSFTSAEGTIWRPTLRDVTFGDLRAGDVRLRIDPFALLRATLAADASLNGPDVKGDVRVERNGGLRLLSKSLVVTGAPLPGVGRLSGETRLQDIEVALTRTSCQSAAGRIESDALAKTLAGALADAAPLMGGVVTCVDRAARFDLNGQSGPDALQAWLDLKGDGSGDWRVAVNSSDPSRAAVFLASGLTPDGKGGFEKRGTLTWLAF